MNYRPHYLRLLSETLTTLYHTPFEVSTSAIDVVHPAGHSIQPGLQTLATLEMQPLDLFEAVFGRT